MVTWNDDLRMALSTALTTDIIDSSDERFSAREILMSRTKHLIEVKLPPNCLEIFIHDSKKMVVTKERIHKMSMSL